MTIPTLEWFPTNITGVLGSFPTWAGGTIDGEAMVDALVVALVPFLKPSASFDQATVYTQASPTSDNIPRASAVLGVAGTSAATTENQAVSTTFNFKTLGNGDSKLVLLDTPIGSNWFRSLLPAAFDANVLALEAEFVATTNAWAGRDDTRVATLRKISIDLNEKLQKQYRMT
jgi:hypothetical protein